VRLNLVITDNQGHTWTDELDVPVWFNVTAFSGIAIDDGRAVNGTTLGTGNGDGAANAGEQVMIHTGTQRLRLYTNDPYVDQETETLYDEVLPSIWPDGYTLSSIVKFKSTCPNNRPVTFLASCETKTYNPIDRGVRWGTVTVTVTGGPVSPVLDRPAQPRQRGDIMQVFPTVGQSPDVRFQVEQLTAGMPAQISIYKLTGELLDQQTVLAGTKIYSWETKDSFGRPLPSGMYFYAVVAGDRREQGRFVIVR
jgi:hypothetical protein